MGSTMSLFQELQEVEEVKEEETTADSALLSNLISQCGIPVEQEVTTFPCSPANSMNSDMETHQSLIEELEDFFGTPTQIPNGFPALAAQSAHPAHSGPSQSSPEQ